MARTDDLRNYLTDVANAIRAKKGTTEKIVAKNFDIEIDNLPKGNDFNINGVIKEYQVSSNGEINTGDFVKYIEATQMYSDVLSGIQVKKRIMAITLDDNHAMLSYISTSGQIRGYIISFDNGSISIGTMTIIAQSSNSTICALKIVPMSSTTVICFYSDTNSKITGVHCSISNKSISVNSTKTDSNISNIYYNGEFFGAVQTTDTTGVLSWADGNDKSKLYMLPFSVSGTTISFHTKTNVFTGTVAATNTRPSYLTYLQNGYVGFVVYNPTETGVNPTNDFTIILCSCGTSVSVKKTQNCKKPSNMGGTLLMLVPITGNYYLVMETRGGDVAGIATITTTSISFLSKRTQLGSEMYGDYSTSQPNFRAKSINGNKILLNTNQDLLLVTANTSTGVVTVDSSISLNSDDITDGITVSSQFADTHFLSNENTTYITDFLFESAESCTVRELCATLNGDTLSLKKMLSTIKEGSIAIADEENKVLGVAKTSGISGQTIEVYVPNIVGE